MPASVTRLATRCLDMHKLNSAPNKATGDGKAPEDADPIQSEAELVERAKQDPEAFAELYERHVDRIYAYVYYRTGDERDAEDLTARVFYRALAHLPDYRPTGAPFIAWLYRIAHNQVANWHRDKTRHPELSLDGWNPTVMTDLAPHAQAERAEEERLLLDAIRALPGDRQHLLLLKFVDGLSNLEIGKILGRSEGAIKSLYHRTLLSLREELEKRGVRQESVQSRPDDRVSSSNSGEA